MPEGGGTKDDVPGWPGRFGKSFPEEDQLVSLFQGYHERRVRARAAMDRAKQRFGLVAFEQSRGMHGEDHFGFNRHEREIEGAGRRARPVLPGSLAGLSRN